MRISCFEFTAPRHELHAVVCSCMPRMRGQKKTTNSHALNSDCVGGTTASSRRRLLGWKDGLCHVLIVPVKHFGVRLPLVRLAPSCTNRLDLMTSYPGFMVRMWSGADTIPAAIEKTWMCRRLSSHHPCQTSIHCRSS